MSRGFRDPSTPLRADLGTMDLDITVQGRSSNFPRSLAEGGNGWTRGRLKSYPVSHTECETRMGQSKLALIRKVERAPRRDSTRNSNRLRFPCLENRETWGTPLQR